mmetsp:Transcript_13789/g.30526  ORF Transcript_13789/g.30526 Transcript_13789/m.30526 type:complete len:253 (+) Transcript_13789:772-1530(+)
MLAAMNQKLRLFQGDGLETQTVEDIEIIADRLAQGLQNATIAQTRTSQCADVTNRLASEPLEVAPFRIPKLPGKNAVTGHADEVCSSVVDGLQHLREIHMDEVQGLHHNTSLLARLLDECHALNSELTDRQTVLERLVEENERAETQLRRLSGGEELATLTTDEIHELCTFIGKCSRKVHLALAMRQINGNTGPIPTPANGMCLVCSEHASNTLLIPCQHTLCHGCACRLNFCPSCRGKISGRQSVIGPGAR